MILEHTGKVGKQIEVAVPIRLPGTTEDTLAEGKVLKRHEQTVHRSVKEDEIPHQNEAGHYKEQRVALTFLQRPFEAALPFAQHQRQYFRLRCRRLILLFCHFFQPFALPLYGTVTLAYTLFKAFAINNLPRLLRLCSLFVLLIKSIADLANLTYNGSSEGVSVVRELLNCLRSFSALVA